MNKQKLIQAYKNETNIRVKERLFLVKQVLIDKQISSHVATQLGRVRAWAYKWLQRFKEEGISGLQDRTRSGRSTSIPEHKLLSIQQQISENQSGWSAKQVMNLIYKKIRSKIPRGTRV